MWKGAKTMKVLIADGLSADAVAALERLNLQVEVRHDLKAETLPEALAETDILIVRSTKVTAAAVQAAPQLSLIAAAGAGTEGIDLAAASGRGIYVAHCPGNDSTDVVLSVELFLKTGHPIGTVNLCARSPAIYRLVVRHLNRVGVLAFILDGLREENINVEEMENTIFAGAEAACCSMLLDEPPSDNLLDFFRGNPSVLHAMLNPCQ
jgi:hypothetical protein